MRDKKRRILVWHTMLEKYSKIILILAIAINVYLVGLTRGFEFQYLKYGFSDPRISGAEYFYICFFLLIFLIGREVKKRFVSNIICLSALAIAAYKYKFIYLFTVGLLDEGEPISLMFRESIPLNLISFSVIILLLIYQIIVIIQDFYSKNRIPLNTF